MRSGRDLEARKRPADQPSPQSIGEELFRALFSGQTGLLWARSIGVVTDRGLRVQLRFKLDEQPPGSSVLHSLPWELLRQPDTRDFLALSRLTPVMRYLEVPRPVSPMRHPSVLRILVVISEPAGLPRLDIARERREIKEAWEDRPEVEVDVLERPCVGALREALLRRSYHILQFIGHGKLDSRTGEGFLFFEDENRAADPVSGEALFTLLKDLTSLRLVFLNACETGRATREAELDPFAGVATALVLGGLPAVVAMQFPIRDTLAIAFSRAVHLRLAAGDPLDVAVTEGRQAIFAADHSTMEWAIPVLFTRVADGRIFEGGGENAKEARPSSFPVLKRQLWGGLAGGILLLLVAFLLQVLLPKLIARPVMEKVRVGAISVGRYEVTQEQFLQFVLANPGWSRDRIPPGLHDGDYLKSWVSPRRYPPGLENHPVTEVSWHAAKAFCEWAGGRLPRLEEAQAAAHTSEHRFPWGAVLSSPPPLNFCDRTCPREYRDRRFGPDGFPETAPVGSFPSGRTREGVFDLSGNVWEWVDEVSGSRRSTLGGSYLSQLDECSTDKPVPEDARLCAPDGGFRCVWD